MTDDPLETLDRNESTEDTVEIRRSVWGIATDDWLGDDREVSDISAENLRVEGPPGDEQVVYDLSATVTKRDPRELPVFESQAHYEWKQECHSRTSLPGWVKPLVSAGVSLGVVALATALSVNVMQSLEMTVNGDAVNAPGYFEVLPVVLVLALLVFAIQYAPRVFRSGGFYE